MSNTTGDQKVVLTNKVYDIAKDSVTIYFPAAVTLYAGLAVLWGWTMTDQVVASAGLVITFLGVVLKISSAQHAKAVAATPAALTGEIDGQLVVNETDPEKDVYRLEIDRTLAELGSKDYIVLKVSNPLANDSQ